MIQASSQDLHRPKPERFNVELSNLEIAEEDLVEVLCNQLKPEILETKNLAYEESDKVQALELGADDYITKPFSTRDLIARVNSVLRNSRGGTQPHQILRLGSLLADLDAREVSVDSRAITLTATEFAILVYLMQRPGQVISRDKLITELWRPDRILEGKRVVDVYVRRLRTKIEPNPDRPCRLLTRRGDGYSLIDPGGCGPSPKKTATVLSEKKRAEKSHLPRGKSLRTFLPA